MSTWWEYIQTRAGRFERLGYVDSVDQAYPGLLNEYNEKNGTSYTIDDLHKCTKYGYVDISFLKNVETDMPIMGVYKLVLSNYMPSSEVNTYLMDALHAYNRDGIKAIDDNKPVVIVKLYGAYETCQSVAAKAFLEHMTSAAPATCDASRAEFMVAITPDFQLTDDQVGAIACFVKSIAEQILHVKDIEIKINNI